MLPTMNLLPPLLIAGLVIALIAITIVGVRAAKNRKLSTGDCIALFTAIITAIAALLAHSHPNPSPEPGMQFATIKVMNGPKIKDGVSILAEKEFEWKDPATGYQYGNGLMFTCSVVLQAPLQGKLRSNYFTQNSLKLLNAERGTAYDGFEWKAPGYLQAAVGVVPGEPFTQVFVVWVDPDVEVTVGQKIPLRLHLYDDTKRHFESEFLLEVVEPTEGSEQGVAPNT